MASIFDDVTIVDVILSLARHKVDPQEALYFKPESIVSDNVNLRREFLYVELLNRIIWCGCEDSALTVNDFKDVVDKLRADVIKIGTQAWREDNEDMGDSQY